MAVSPQRSQIMGTLNALKSRFIEPPDSPKRTGECFRHLPLLSPAGHFLQSQESTKPGASQRGLLKL